MRENDAKEERKTYPRNNQHPIIPPQSPPSIPLAVYPQSQKQCREDG